MLPKLKTRVLLFVVLAFNVVALGAAEVQRRALVQDFPDMQSAEQLKMNRMLVDQQSRLEQQVTLLGQLRAEIDITNKKIAMRSQEISAKIDDVSGDLKRLSDRVH